MAEGKDASHVGHPLRNEAVSVMCPECGALIEVHDVRAVLLAMHLTNECSELSGLFPVRSAE